jgi:hypothetical protein
LSKTNPTEKIGIERQTIQWRKENRRKNKQWSTKHYTENSRFSNTNLTENIGIEWQIIQWWKEHRLFSSVVFSPLYFLSFNPYFFCGVRFAQSLVFCVVFCRSLFVFSSVFFSGIGRQTIQWWKENKRKDKQWSTKH